MHIRRHMKNDYMDKPIYRVKRKNDKWIVERPDSTAVNGAAHATRKEAERQLSFLVAYKLCEQENNNAPELQKHRPENK